MRIIYSILWYMITPFIPLYLYKKKNHKYRLKICERFGIKLHNESTKPIIWIHCVSVGETRAAQKLVDVLLKQYANYQILITNTTPTGRDTAEKLYPQATIKYIPYDIPHAVINFYKTFKPCLCLIMETEIWPNIIYYANKFRFPIYLINARLSDKSFNNYNKFKYFISPIINKFTGILCQNNLTKNNFIRLGCKNILEVIGNIKFDVKVDYRQFETATYFTQKIADKKVITFASSRDEEEKMLLDNLPEEFNYLIIIIPRHPERFELVENLIKSYNLKYQKRSDNKPIENDTKIFIGNSLGEMNAYYQISSLVIMGGSFNNFGCQSLIEPLSQNKPVIVGPSIFNFHSAVKDALKTKCILQVDNMYECINMTEKIINSNTLNILIQNCQKFIGINKGSSKKIVQVIAKHL